jgi:hypothetical protein
MAAASVDSRRSAYRYNDVARAAAAAISPQCPHGRRPDADRARRQTIGHGIKRNAHAVAECLERHEGTPKVQGRCGVAKLRSDGSWSVRAPSRTKDFVMRTTSPASGEALDSVGEATMCSSIVAPRPSWNAALGAPASPPTRPSKASARPRCALSTSRLGPAGARPSGRGGRVWARPKKYRKAHDVLC